MNTQQAQTPAGRRALQEHLIDLMIADGFGTDEVRQHISAYTKEIFGGHSLTGKELIERELRRMEA